MSILPSERFARQQRLIVLLGRCCLWCIHCGFFQGKARMVLFIMDREFWDSDTWYLLTSKRVSPMAEWPARLNSSDSLERKVWVNGAGRGPEFTLRTWLSVSPPGPGRQVSDQEHLTSDIQGLCSCGLSWPRLRSRPLPEGKHTFLNLETTGFCDLK